MEQLTQLRLLRGVPLSNSYELNVIYSTKEDQYNDFGKYVKYDLFNLSYERFKENVIKVNKRVEDLYDVNYIIFNNTNYSNKNFYGFVINVEYVADNVSNIYYELDVIQTYMFDIEFTDCLIEREHVDDDTVGKHILGEGFDVGEYVITSKTELKGEGLDLAIYVTDVEGVEGLSSFLNPPAMLGGVPVSCYGITLQNNATSLTYFKQVIDEIGKAGKLDSIVAMFTMPSNFHSNNEFIKAQDVGIASRSLTFTPRNNKMYTYPYCYCCIEGGNERKTLLYEKMGEGANLSVLGGFGPNMSVVAIPTFYDGQPAYFDGAVTCSDYPMLSWIGNYYQNWVAEKTPHLSAQGGTSVIKALSSGAGVGVATGNPVLGVGAGVVSLATSVIDVWQQDASAQIVPDKLSGQINASEVLAITGELGFRTYCMSVRSEVGQAIDNYFTMYGYKVNRLGKPHLMKRKNYNYIKLYTPNIIGGINNEDLNRIKDIYTNGVCFWKQLQNVGNYSLENGVINE